MMFENNIRLEEHMETHQPDTDCRPESDECSITLGETSKLDKHEKTHHSNID